MQSGERADIRAVAQAVGRERAARHAGGVVHDVKHAILWAICGRGAIVRRPKERTWVTPGAVREITFKTCKATYMSYFSFERSSSTSMSFIVFVFRLRGNSHVCSSSCLNVQALWVQQGPRRGICLHWHPATRSLSRHRAVFRAPVRERSHCVRCELESVPLLVQVSN